VSWTPEVPPDEVRRRLDAGGLDRREAYRLQHQHPLNRATHVVGIPLVIASAVVPFVVWARTGAFGWRELLALWSVGWALQFLGHGIEGNSPAFFRDVRQLLVGPLFVLTLPWQLLRRRK
jgi:uncharacterized membrane protein YGL010W